MYVAICILGLEKNPPGSPGPHRLCGIGIQDHGRLVATLSGFHAFTGGAPGNKEKQNDNKHVVFQHGFLSYFILSYYKTEKHCFKL
jgi:hypothetical protein